MMNDFFARGDLSRCIPILFDRFDVSSVDTHIHISRTRQSREREREREGEKERVCDEGRRERRRSH
jgi:hypothetical protein